MQNLPSNNLFTTTGPRPNMGTFAAAWEAVRDFCSQLTGAAPETVLTLVSDVATPTQAAHVIAAESGTSDNLAQLGTSGVVDGTRVRIRPDAGDTITVKHNTGSVGKILLSDAVDFVMSDPSMGLWLVYSLTAQTWTEDDRNYGNNKSAFRTWLGLVIGTTVQGYSDLLAALAGITQGSNKLPYMTSALNTWATTDLTSYARTLLALGSKAAVQAELEIVTAPVIRDYIAGFQITGMTNTTVTIGAGQCADSNNGVTIDYAGGTIDFATNGANGLRTGLTLTAGQKGGIFVISGTSGEAFFADTALTPGTRPSGYTAAWRRVATFEVDASTHLVPVKQNGRWVQRTTLTDFNGVASSTRSNVGVGLPTGKKWRVRLQVISPNASTSTAGVIVRDPDTTDQAASLVSGALLTVASPVSSGISGAGQIELVTNTSSEVAIRVMASANPQNVYFNLLEWEEDGLQ